MGRCDQMYMGTNTKMSMTDQEAVDYLQELAAGAKNLDKEWAQLFVIPSYTVLHRAAAILAGQEIWLGAQNMCWEDRGQYTGEISPVSLQEMGVTVVEIGHSERRHIFRETDEEERRKVCKACEHGLTPLLCIGETTQEKDYGVADEVLSMQLKIGAGGLGAEEAERLMIAYEPVWAIGEKGIPADPGYVGLRHRKIRNTLVELFGPEVGGDVPVLFGGSVNPQNAPDYIRLPEVNGLFVGRSAWVKGGLVGLLRQCLPLYQEKLEKRKEG